MSTIRIAQRRRFTTICNEAVEDTRLSYRARGVLLWLLSKPDDWKINSRLIAEYGTEGRDAVIAALKELEVVGYIRRVKVQRPGGTWITQTFLYESPSPENQEPVNQEPVFQDVKDLVLKVSTENNNNATSAQKPQSPERKQAIGICRRWWELQNPRPAQNFIAIVKVVETMLKHGWEPALVEQALVELPVVTGKAADYWLSTLTPKPKANTNGGRRWDERRKIWLEPGVG